MKPPLLVCPPVVRVSRQPLLRRPMWRLFGGEGQHTVVRKLVTHNRGEVQ